MATRIRGQEVLVGLIVDGNLMDGSFSKVEDFRITPRADLTDSSFLGETEDEPDVMHHGYDFSFSMHEQDNRAFQVWDEIVNRHTAGVPLPNINMLVIKRYRDPGVLPVSMTMENCAIKMDSQEFGSRKDYVKSSWSGKCRTKATR